MKKILIINCLILLSFLGYCQKVDKLKVRIFSADKVKELKICPSFGTYYVNNTKLKRTDFVNFVIKDKQILATIGKKDLSLADSFLISSKDLKCFFLIEPKDLKPRRYDNDLIIKLNKQKDELLLINYVNEDNYLASVVQSEVGGASNNVEFFKVQAICSRSYMHRFINKHITEGYNLCDGVNCQVYLSRANKPECIEGSLLTTGMVIVDKNNNIIETIFHSNSGGQTVDSKDVWGNSIPYLQSVIDSFSIGQEHYKWEKDIKQKQWLNYFKSKGINTKDKEIKDQLLNFSQNNARKKDIFGIPLTQIRKDFDLKSTYFDVVIWGSDVKLKGKGYGHGVGLSQEGAVKMADQGYDYQEIINYYYKGVKIKDLNKK